MAQRGRPRKLAVVEDAPQDKVILDKIAAILQTHCGMPGCLIKWHMEEARQILNVVREG